MVDGLTGPAPALTRRDIWLPTVANKAIAVIGVRRAGKTSLLWQILADRLVQGTPREGLLYFSFEDERLVGIQAKDLDMLVEEYYRLYPQWRDQQRATFMLDEIQVVAGWEVFARRILDSEKIDLFLSGSSARLLSREVATSMRGRAMEAVVLPFSFRESLRHAGCEPQTRPDLLTKADRSLLDNNLRSFLEHGGFPEAQGLDVRNRTELLRSYIDVVLLRDVVERHAVSLPLVLRWMVRQLLGNAAGSFSVNKFHVDLKSQGIAVGKDTLHSYLGHLEDAFLVRSLAIATDSERRRRVNPRKIYPIDPGLIPIFDRSGKANLGHALETAVFLELIRRGAELAYVRTAKGFEVDFLCRHVDGHEELIQVCASIDHPGTFAREIRALQDASGEFPLAGRVLITLDRPPVIDVPADITVIEARDWLLGSDGGQLPGRPAAAGGDPGH
ncbi:MAG: ATPase [Deltaproteobacteria bacterium RIFOXYD12_FULL_57_12]|nr:MAG: ATPase [Deltaproteobacteria bacterium RIFOXYD12_FULL_57_12]